MDAEVGSPMKITYQYAHSKWNSKEPIEIVLETPELFSGDDESFMSIEDMNKYKHIKRQNDLKILVGLNGTGKTTLLKLIDEFHSVQEEGRIPSEAQLSTLVNSWSYTLSVYSSPACIAIPPQLTGNSSMVETPYSSSKFCFKVVSLSSLGLCPSIPFFTFSLIVFLNSYWEGVGYILSARLAVAFGKIMHAIIQSPREVNNEKLELLENAETRIAIKMKTKKYRA